MPDCPALDICPFFNDKMADMPATTSVIKRKFCRGDYCRCARFMVSKALSNDKVPKNLYPNDTRRAEKILEEEKNDNN